MERKKRARKNYQSERGGKREKISADLSGNRIRQVWSVTKEHSKEVTEHGTTIGEAGKNHSSLKGQPNKRKSDRISLVVGSETTWIETLM